MFKLIKEFDSSNKLRSLVLKDNQFVITKHKDGSKFVLSNTNILGGVCDDCTNQDFDSNTIIKASVYEVE